MKKQKIINLLIDISNDLIPNKTKVIIGNELYIYNKKTKRLKRENQYRIFYGSELNDIVIIITDEVEHEKSNN